MSTWFLGYIILSMAVASIWLVIGCSSEQSRKHWAEAAADESPALCYLGLTMGTAFVWVMLVLFWPISLAKRIAP